MHPQSSVPGPSRPGAARVHFWRALWSFLIVAVGLSTFYYTTAIAPNPDRWFYNASANGFLLFVTTIAAGIGGLPACVITYGVLTLLRVPRSPDETDRDSGSPGGGKLP